MEKTRNQVKAWTGVKGTGNYNVLTLDGTNVAKAKAAAAKLLISALKVQNRKAPDKIISFCK